jgi:hypothetical protein
VKVGGLERSLSHLVGVAKAARACLATVEGEVSALRVALHTDGREADVVSGVDRAGVPASLEAAYK